VANDIRPGGRISGGTRLVHIGNLHANQQYTFYIKVSGHDALLENKGGDYNPQYQLYIGPAQNVTF